MELLTGTTSITPTSQQPADISTMTGISLGLARISRLLTQLGSPHLATPIVHIAGTNGKGSVSAYISSILSSSSLRVGRFNSPHLVDEWDCVQIAGKPVSQPLFQQLKLDVETVNAQESIGATSFEVLTATAFSIFARVRPKLDVAVVEVGMGGLTDATNVVSAERTLLSVVTSIELDHQKFLGDTVADIARVKAGITKRGCDVVMARQVHKDVPVVVAQTAQEMGSRVWTAGEAKIVKDGIESDMFPPAPLVRIPLVPADGDVDEQIRDHVQCRLPLAGSYQLQNSAVAVLAAVVLRSRPRTLSLVPELSQITNECIASGIEQTDWPGRLSWLDVPRLDGRRLRLLVDGAHNPSSSSVLASYIASLPNEYKPKTLVTALSSPRTPSSILDPILSCTGIEKVFATKFTKPVGMEWVQPVETRDIATYLKQLDKRIHVDQFDDVRNVLDRLRSSEIEDETVLVAGSLYLVADVYRYLRNVPACEIE
ncbi:folylpolyglutamate synthase [Microbotryomycetes sp. JL201]|nr:folylpolyglutamate synthase [Microbotryomycetes sp. JL201]